MSDALKCCQCGVIAEVNFTWLTSQGSQTANLCHLCASRFWKQHEHTNAGQTLIINPLYDLENGDE